MILSFAYTTEEFLSGQKTCTRRIFKPRHIATWQHAWDTDPCRIHDAYDKSPRWGGRWIGEFYLACRPYLQRLADMPEEDLLAEGGMCATREEFAELIGYPLTQEVLVIRFQCVPWISPWINEPDIPF